MRGLLFSVALWLLVLPAAAYEVQSFTVTHQQGLYRLSLQAQLAAPPKRVYALLSDFEHLSRFNASVQSVKVEPTPGGLLLQTHAQGCFSGFCRKLFNKQLVQLQEMPDGGTIRSTTLASPEGSFESGSSVVTVSGKAAATIFVVQSESRPSFWLPPLIGPWAVEQRMREDALAALASLERLANE